MYDHSDAGDPSSTWTISTPVAGISATALMVVSTASAIPIVGVHNPANSGKRVIIQRAIAHQVTGTAVSYMWGVIASAAAMPVTNMNALRHTTFAQSTGIASSTFFNGTTAVVGTPVMFRPLGGNIAGATGIGANSKVEETYEAGDNIVAYPGTFVGIFADTTGSAAIVRASLTITEVDA